MSVLCMLFTVLSFQIRVIMFNLSLNWGFISWRKQSWLLQTHWSKGYVARIIGCRPREETEKSNSPQVHVIRLYITTAVVERTSKINNFKLHYLVTHCVFYRAAIMGVWVVTICHTVVSLVITSEGTVIICVRHMWRHIGLLTKC